MKSSESARMLAILKTLGAGAPVEAPPPPEAEPTYPGTVPAAAADTGPSAALARLAKRKPRLPTAGTGLVDAGQAAQGPGVNLGPATPPQPQAP